MLIYQSKTALVSLAAEGHSWQFGQPLFIPPAILGALLAVAVCWLLFNIGVTTGYILWHQLTCLLNAVFWCGLGALGYFFAGILMQHPAY